MNAPDPRTLIAHERALPAVPPGVRERILARVHTTVGAPPGPGSGGGGAPAVAPAFAPLVVLKVALVAAAIGGLVAVGFLLSGSPSEPVSDAVPVVPHVLPSSASPAARVIAAANVPPVVPALPTPLPAAVQALAPPAEPPALAPSSSTPAPRPINTLPLERAILDRAQTALAQRDTTAALAAVEVHASRFARGALSEEREALRIRALMVAGRTDDARSAFVRFGKRFPRSIHRAAFETVFPP